MSGAQLSFARRNKAVAMLALATLLPQLRAESEPCLDEGTAFPTTDAVNGDSPIAVEVCDLNNDGELDLVTANDASDTVSILIGLGDGTYSAPLRWPVGNSPDETIEPVDVVCCDIDGDTLLDLVTANHASDDVSILFNEGNVAGEPQFAAPVRYTVGEAPWAVRCLAANVDIHADLVVANFTSDSVSVLLNVGDGTFSPTSSYDVAVGDGPRSLVICDVDNDLDQDVITANFVGADITVLRNDGDAGFIKIGDFPVGANPIDIACCELDGTNGVDVVTANLFDDSVAVLPNDGTGAFRTSSRYGSVAGPFGVACSDLNGDKNNDVVTANLTGDNVAIFLNPGDGSLLDPTFYPVGTNPASIVTVDVTGNGSPDIVATSGDGVTVFTNDCTVAGDSDGDGDFDLFDFGAFQVCFALSPADMGCESFDLDGDGSIGLDDFAMLDDLLMGPIR